MASKKFSIRQKIGIAVYDLVPFFWYMRPVRNGRAAPKPWTLIRNRNEHVLIDPKSRGASCEWEWTSELHLANVFPILGLMLMKRAVESWPIIFKEKPEKTSDHPEISFVIGHRGIDRLPHLQMTLRSIAGQRNVTTECIIVEQSLQPEIQKYLPSWVRYIHTPLPDRRMLYSRSWSFNVGARMAHGKVLIFHDNDMLIPADYGSEMMVRMGDYCEVVNLKRFIFYLTQRHTSRIFNMQSLVLDEPAESVIQNLKGGGSFAIKKETYLQLGGFDEEFVGWGGEDVEFWHRASTRNMDGFASMPIIHLWHSPQTGKREVRGMGRSTVELTERRNSIPPEDRIQELCNRSFGNPNHPDPPYKQSTTFELEESE
jgi:Glycosyltransferase like family 2